MGYAPPQKDLFKYLVMNQGYTGRTQSTLYLVRIPYSRYTSHYYFNTKLSWNLTSRDHILQVSVRNPQN